MFDHIEVGNNYHSRQAEPEIKLKNIQIYFTYTAYLKIQCIEHSKREGIDPLQRKHISFVTKTV